jgi:hypothetical protein
LVTWKGWLVLDPPREWEPHLPMSEAPSAENVQKDKGDFNFQNDSPQIPERYSDSTYRTKNLPTLLPTFSLPTRHTTYLLLAYLPLNTPPNAPTHLPAYLPTYPLRYLSIHLPTYLPKCLLDTYLSPFTCSYLPISFPTFQVRWGSKRQPH